MKSALTFDQTERDTQTGAAEWDILDAGKCVGTIRKDTVHVGDGYRADSYSVEVVPFDGDPVEESFGVANTWSQGKGMTARQAMAACKAFARKHLLNEAVCESCGKLKPVCCDEDNAAWCAKCCTNPHTPFNPQHDYYPEG